MVGLDLIQVTCFICWIACVDGQALYEEKCKIKIDQDVQQLYDREIQLQKQVNDLKDQLGSCGVLVKEECKRSSSGYDYAGNVSVTQSEITCQAWNSQTPHKHNLTSLPENYCRNPDGEPAPWCYTTDPDKRWEICNIPDCVPCSCPLECLQRNDPKGKKYFGTLNVTKTGEPCQRWNSTTPHKHKFGVLADQENYCRNPDEDNGPWCYTTRGDKLYCIVPHC